MTQLEKFSLHFPYKPLIEHTIYDAFGDIVSIEKRYNLTEHSLSFVNYMDYWFDVENECEIKPYLRSFDQLTKKCVQADYNDGKPFVPVEEIKKELLHPDMKWGKHSAYEWVGFSDNKSNHIPVLFLNDFSEECPFWIFNLLLKWHFCVGFGQGEYIEVTNEINPY